jgi:hypothetical protein
MELELYNKRDAWLNLPEDISWDKFTQVLDELGGANQKLQWLIGDALLFCEGKWKDRIDDAKKRTGLAGNTLNNYIVVSRAFPTTQRRVSLTWMHHCEAMRAEPKDRSNILAQAESNKWSTRDIRFALSEHGGEEKEKGAKIGFLPAEWALEMKRWLGTQPQFSEWDEANLLALKSRFDKDIIPIYQAICKAIESKN